jgi:hypothetical protein
MAKKSHRKKREVRLSPTQLMRPGVTGVADASIAIEAAAPDLRKTYGHVTTDLKRMGIVAVAALVVVIFLVIVLV